MNSMNGDECIVRTQKRMVPCRSNLDIISNIPSNILEKILTCLPMQDAARTSVLSKQWRYSWLHIPQLVFNDEMFFKSRSSKSPTEICSQIYQILLMHCGNLHKFVLSIPGDVIVWDVKTESCLISRIALFLTKKDIHELTLMFPFCAYRMPLTLYQCVQLTHLNLFFGTFRLPLEFEGFNRLISVELEEMVVTGDDFNAFISKSPLLQQLRLTRIIHLGNPLEIDAPNLKFMSIFSILRGVVFKNVHKLSTLIFNYYGGAFTTFADSVIENVLGALPAIQYLSTNLGRTLLSVPGAIPKRLPVTLNHLKDVEFSSFSLSTAREVQVALLLIQSASKLETLTIKGKYFIAKCVDEAFSRQLYEVLNEGGNSFIHLQQVIFKVFWGTVQDLEFVKVLLANSPVLKMMTIQLPEGTSSKKELKILKAVTRFKRASTNAEIIFVD